jgi:hypothetical protein
LQELPKELRNLNFPKYPFSAGKFGPLPPSVLEFFQKHQIVYYRDEAMPFGITIQPLDGDETEMMDREGFIAFRSSGVCDSRTLQMCHWQKERYPRKYRKIVEKQGDDCMWFMWNKLVTVQGMDEEEVRCI